MAHADAAFANSIRTLASGSRLVFRSVELSGPRGPVDWVFAAGRAFGT